MDDKDKNLEIDLMQYWRIISQKRYVIITCLVSVLILVAMFTFTAMPIYKATTTLLIEDKASKLLSIEDEFGINRQVADRSFISTEINLLGRRSLAERVAVKLNLSARDEFTPPTNPIRGVLSSIKNIITFKWLKAKQESESLLANDRINADIRTAGTIMSNLEIKPVKDTRLVDVSYTSPSPEIAADIVNTLAQEYMAFSIEKRSTFTQLVYNYYDEQIANLKELLAEKRKELQRIGQEKNIPVMSDTDVAIVSQFSRISDDYYKAQLDTQRARSRLSLLQNASVQSFPHITDDVVIQGLYSNYTQLTREYDEMKIDKLPDHPDMVRRRNSLLNLEKQIESEMGKSILAAEQEYQKALDNQIALRNMRDRQIRETQQMDADYVQYRLLDMEVEKMNENLAMLMQSREQIGISANLEGFKSSNISVIDSAVVPTSPISPQKTKNMILGILIGLFGGVGLAFSLDFLDNAVKGPEDIEKLTGLPSLGVIPYLPPEGIKKKKRGAYLLKYLDYYSYGKDESAQEEQLNKVKKIELINHLHPQFFISEDYRTIRTSVMLSNAQGPPKSLLLTSALPQEGKSTTSTNLAVAFSQLTEKVLIIDADLRKPRLHQIFEVKNVGGLSGYLTGKTPLQDAIKMSAIQNIWVIPSGPIPPNPAELLNSDAMGDLLDKAKQEFDIILVDSPPVMAAIDTIVLASAVDGVLFVVHGGHTPDKVFVKAVEELRKTKTNILGVVLNEVRVDRGGYFYRDYYHYGQSYTANEK